MTPEHEVLTIPKCPNCGKPHAYRLEVDRTYVMSFMTTTSGGLAMTYKEFTRLFTCSETGEDFQARFRLTESSSARIKCVRVLGLDEEHLDD